MSSEKELVLEQIDDCWEAESSLEIMENDGTGKGVVDGENILARVSGPAFFPDKTSRNNRFYPKKLWEEVLSSKDLLDKLRDKKLFGTVGHDLPLNEDSIRDGQISHIVSKMWIDKKSVGRAEFLILNTTSGRALNTLLRAGTKLAVSTRARAYSKKDSSGVFQMVPGQFMFQGIDFVIDPGYEKAVPEVVESSLSKEGVTKVTTKIEEVKRMSEMSEKAEFQALNQKLEKLTNESDMALKEKYNVANETLVKYAELGTEKFISEELAVLKSYRKVGNTPEELESIVKNSNDILDTCEKDHEAYSQFEAEIASYKELGTVEHFADLLAGVASSDEWLQGLIENSDELKEIGTIEDILKLNEEYKKLAEEFQVGQFERLEKEYGVSSSEIAGLCDKNGMTFVQVESILESMKTSSGKSPATKAKKLSTSVVKGIPATPMSEATETLAPNSLLDTLFFNRK